MYQRRASNLKVAKLEFNSLYETRGCVFGKQVMLLIPSRCLTASSF